MERKQIVLNWYKEAGVIVTMSNSLYEEYLLIHDGKTVQIMNKEYAAKIKHKKNEIDIELLKKVLCFIEQSVVIENENNPVVEKFVFDGKLQPKAYKIDELGKDIDM